MGLFGPKMQKDIGEGSTGQECGLYAIYDRVAEECGPVFSAKNDGVAMRGFRDLLQQVSDKSEYQLVRLGKVDMHSLKLSVEVTPVEITLPPSQLDLLEEGKVSGGKA